MIVFNSDLDNTLIYSYKKNIGINKVNVEIYQGREISFMTEKSFRLLKEINEKLLFVPTTTRSIEQYKRIDFGFSPKFALVCNGGVMLIDGEKDLEWYNKSLKIAEKCMEDLEKGINLLKQDINRSFEIRFIENLFIFTKSEQPEETCHMLKKHLDLEKVGVFQNGTKVYIVPKDLNKGTAINRFRKWIGAETIITAGDSDFDIPMLENSDVAFAPTGLFENPNKKDCIHILGDEQLFSDMLLDEIKKGLEN